MNAARLANVVDTHVHFWDPHRLRYRWLADVPALNHPHEALDFVRAAVAEPITKFIVVEADCDHAQGPEEVEWISRIAALEPRLKGIVAQVALENGASASARLAMLARNPLVKGVRRILQMDHPDFLLRPEFVAGVGALEEYHFTFDLCVVPAQLGAVAELVRRCPAVQFILDHCGKPAIRAGSFEQWASDMSRLADLPNVVCKISGLSTEADAAHLNPEVLAPYVRHAWDCFGADRVLFGSDWPVCNLATSYSQWMSLLRTALPVITPSDLEKFYLTNAERIYHV